MTQDDQDVVEDVNTDVNRRLEDEQVKVEKIKKVKVAGEKKLKLEGAAKEAKLEKPVSLKGSDKAESLKGDFDELETVDPIIITTELIVEEPEVVEEPEIIVEEPVVVDASDVNRRLA